MFKFDPETLGIFFNSLFISWAIFNLLELQIIINSLKKSSSLFIIEKTRCSGVTC